MTRMEDEFGLVGRTSAVWVSDRSVDVCLEWRASNTVGLSIRGRHVGSDDAVGKGGELVADEAAVVVAALCASRSSRRRPTTLRTRAA